MSTSKSVVANKKSVDYSEDCSTIQISEKLLSVSGLKILMQNILTNLKVDTKAITWQEMSLMKSRRTGNKMNEI